MKKILLLIGLLFQLTISYGQVVRGKTPWKEEDWMTLSCFSSIQFRLYCDYKPNNEGDYQWLIQFKNLMNTKIQFSYVIANDQNSLVSALKTSAQFGVSHRSDGGFLYPGEVSNETGAFLSTKNVPVIAIGYVQISQSSKVNDWKLEYQLCDNSQACPLCAIKPIGLCKNKEASTLKNSTTTGRISQNETALSKTSTNVPANDPILQAGNQLMGAMNQLAVEQQEEAKLNIGKDAQREIVELSKLEIEPENEFVNSPEDYLNVSLTTQKIASGSNKLGTISITRNSLTIFESEDDVKTKVYKATKINASFFGANTVFVKSLDFRRILADKPVVEILGFAYNNKTIEFSEVETAFKLNKSYKTAECYKYKINQTDFDKEKSVKNVEINSVVKTENAINVNAKIEGVKFSSFKMINFSKTSFTLMYFDKEKEKIYNYVIAIQ